MILTPIGWLPAGSLLTPNGWVWPTDKEEEVMPAELWLHRPCVHGHEGSFRTHPPVAEMLRGDELPCEGGRPQVRLDPDKVVFKPWAVDAMAKAREQITVQDVIDALEEE